MFLNIWNNNEQVRQLTYGITAVYKWTVTYVWCLTAHVQIQRSSLGRGTLQTQYQSQSRDPLHASLPTRADFRF